MLSGRRSEQGGRSKWRPAQIERPDGFLAQELLQAGCPEPVLSQVTEFERKLCVGQDALVWSPILGCKEGAQRLMPANHLVQASPQGQWV